MSFVRTYTRVVHDALGRSKQEAILVGTLDAVAAGSRGLVIATTVFFVNVLSGSGPGPMILGYELDRAYGSVVALATAMLVLLLSSAGASYLSVLVTRRLARRHQASCAKRVLDHLASQMYWNPQLEEDSPGAFMKKIVRGALHTGFAVETVLQMSASVCGALVGASVVIYLDLEISVVLFLLALVIIPFVYRLNSRILLQSRRFFSISSPTMSKKVSLTLAQLNSTELSRDCRPAVESLFSRDAAYTNYLDGLDNIRLGGQRMRLLSAVLLSFVLVFAVVAFSIQAVDGDRPWGNLVGYVVGLLFLVTSIQGVLVQGTNLSRFYPAVRELADFFDEVETGADCQMGMLVELPEQITITAESREKGEPQSIVFTPGSPLLFVTGDKVGRFNYSRTIVPLVESSSIGMESWKAARVISDISCFGDQADVARIRNNVANLRHMSAYVQPSDADMLQIGLDELETSAAAVRESGEWTELSSGSRTLLRLVSAIEQQPCLILVDLSLLSGLSEVQQRLVEVLSQHCFLVVMSAVVDMPDLTVGAVAISDGKRVVSVGDSDWLSENLSLLRPRTDKPDGDTVVEDTVLMDMI